MDSKRKEQDLYTELMCYIDRHIYEISKLSQLSRIFGYNYCYLSYLFKKNRGITLFAYYKERKLTIAKELLEQGVRVSVVADKLNYASLFSFSKAYKKHWGVSPKKHNK